MNSSGGISGTTVLLFVVLLSTQIITILFLPKTNGFTDPRWTVLCVTLYSVSLWSLAYMIHKGMPISLVIPILAALVPLASVGIGIVVYKEAASLLKILLLCGACGLIGLASSVGPAASS